MEKHNFKSFVSVKNRIREQNRNRSVENKLDENVEMLANRQNDKTTATTTKIH